MVAHFRVSGMIFPIPLPVFSIAFGNGNWEAHGTPVCAAIKCCDRNAIKQRDPAYRGVDRCNHRVTGILTIQMPSGRPVSACGFSLLSVSGARFGTRYEIRIAPQKRGDGHPEIPR